MPDDFGLVEAVDGLCQGVVVAIAHASDGGHEMGLGQALGVIHGEVLNTPVAVMDQPVLGTGPAGGQILCILRELELMSSRFKLKSIFSQAKLKLVQFWPCGFNVHLAVGKTKPQGGTGGHCPSRSYGYAPGGGDEYEAAPEKPLVRGRV